jgi:hypothetical protein
MNNFANVEEKKRRRIETEKRGRRTGGLGD